MRSIAIGGAIGGERKRFGVSAVGLIPSSVALCYLMQ